MMLYNCTYKYCISKSNILPSLSIKEKERTIEPSFTFLTNIFLFNLFYTYLTFAAKSEATKTRVTQTQRHFPHRARNVKWYCIYLSCSYFCYFIIWILDSPTSLNLNISLFSAKTSMFLYALYRIITSLVNLHL